MEQSLEPPAKKTRYSYTEICVFCEGSLLKLQLDNRVVENPTKDGLKSILHTAQIRREDVFDRLSPIQGDILNGDMEIKFHKNCRAKYTTKRNVHYARSRESAEGSDSSSADKGDEKGLSRLRRLETSKFNIRTNCFVCEKPYIWNEKLTQISTGTGASTRQRVLVPKWPIRMMLLSACAKS